MRRAVIIGTLTCALAYVCGCSLDPDKDQDKTGYLDSIKEKITQFLPSHDPTLPNATAVDRALQQSTLVESNLPFHLVLEITPAPNGPSAMQAQVEIFWLNPLTYRTVIHSPTFTQTRIVNGGVVEEHNTSTQAGPTYYPRWLQNFVDALLDPLPNSRQFRKIPGSVPVTPQSHPCLTMPDNASPFESQVCLQGAEPRLASFQSFTRYVSFDDYAPFGSQEIPRRLVNSLPAAIPIQGRIVRIEPLQQSGYKLLKATQYTPPSEKISTSLVAETTALSLLQPNPRQSWPPIRTTAAGPASESTAHIYIRTDRTGQVREAYRDAADQYGMQNRAIAQALRLKFKPLLINNIPQQMEAPLTLP